MSVVSVLQEATICYHELNKWNSLYLGYYIYEKLSYIRFLSKVNLFLNKRNHLQAGQGTWGRKGVWGHKALW